MTLHTYPHENAVNHALAEAICTEAQAATASRGQFHFVLSGGHTPAGLYRLLSSAEFKDKMPWQKTWFYFGDERFVPKGDERRNSLMAARVLFDSVEVPAGHILEMDTTGTPEEAAQRYEAAIKSRFADAPIRFDFVLLGLGANAHTASLFPHTPVLDETRAAVKPVFVKDQDMYRITMTAPLINQARQVAFLVFGKDKAKAVALTLEDGDARKEDCPAKLVHPVNGELHWFLDDAAASLLKSKKQPNS